MGEWIGIAEDLTADNVVGEPFVERRQHAPLPSRSSNPLKGVAVVGGVGMVLLILASNLMSSRVGPPPSPILPVQQPEPPPPSPVVVAAPAPLPQVIEAPKEKPKVPEAKPHKAKEKPKPGSAPNQPAPQNGTGGGGSGPSSEIDLERYRNLMRGL